jgi:quercetin 2,3-dioxygenase
VSIRIPSAYPEGNDGPVQIKIISGKTHGVESPVRPLGGCWYFHVIFKQPSSVFIDLPAGWTSFAYLLKGTARVGSDPSDPPHDAYHTLVLSSDKDQSGVLLAGAVADTELILVAGEPLDQTVFQYGPFVMTTREEIQQTLMDCESDLSLWYTCIALELTIIYVLADQLGQNGFEKAHTFKSTIGGLRR